MKNDGGSVFPSKANARFADQAKGLGLEVIDNPGMSLRDYFAAKAMQSLLSDSRYGGIVGVNCYEQYRAIEAYQIADAMLAQREKD